MQGEEIRQGKGLMVRIVINDYYNDSKSVLMDNKSANVK